jgi:hypothetical protein
MYTGKFNVGGSFIMKCYAIVDELGFVKQTIYFYEDDSTPDEGLIEIDPSEESTIFQKRWILDQWVDLPLRPIYPNIWDNSLENWIWLEVPHKTSLKQQIDIHAESTRLKFITGGAGQSMEYQESYSQAKTKKTDPSANVPMVAADRVAGLKNPLTGVTIQTDDEAADIIIYMYEQWLLVGSEIRRIRLQAKRQIDEAITPETLETIYNNAVAELDAL